jgi:hypothetical protein
VISEWSLPVDLGDYVDMVFVSGHSEFNPVEGGVMGRLNNEAGSIFRVSSGVETRIVKTNNSMRNVAGFVKNRLSEIGVSADDASVVSLLDTYSIAPGMKEAYVLDFLNRCSPDTIPSLYRIDIDPIRERWYCVMEDLGHWSIAQGLDCGESTDDRFLNSAVDALADLHRNIRAHGGGLGLPHVPTLTVDKIQTILPMLSAALPRLLSSTDSTSEGACRDWVETLPSQLASVVERLASGNQILTQSDFGSRNCAYRSDVDGMRVKIFDWDAARVQNPVVDFVELFLHMAEVPAPDRFWNLASVYSTASGYEGDRRRLHRDINDAIRLLVMSKWWLYAVAGDLGRASRLATNAFALLKVSGDPE